jgi:hypothetical protein
MKSFMLHILKSRKLLLNSTSILVIILGCSFQASCQQKNFIISRQDYQDRVQAIWTAQMLGAMMGWPFEHKVASTEWINTLNPKFTHAPVDDDWYYEMVAIRAFEKYGVNMTVQQLGQQWQENSAGSWGSSEQARLLMQKGIKAPDCGNPRYNKLWFTIGPQFSSDVYGALTPGMPNLAASIARKYGHINGYAEGVDGGVFVAAMISLGFVEKDPKAIVTKAAHLINPASPYRQCLDMIINLAKKGKSAHDIYNTIEQRWHIEYPATNNAVANGGIVATSVWFGQGDFLKTINLAYSAADFTDADCNAANAGSVVAAMHGMRALPIHLVQALNDSILGDKMGKVPLTPAVKESISGLAKRTAAIGEKLLKKNGGVVTGEKVVIKLQQPQTQSAELFQLADLTQYWNPGWKLERAGYGGAQGGMPGIRGITWLDNDVLATYPRDEIKGVLLSKTIKISNQHRLSFDAGVDSGRVWQCMVYVNNKKMFDEVLEGGPIERKWYPIKVDLSSFKDSTIKVRLYQRVLIPGKASGDAYWKNLQIL